MRPSPLLGIPLLIPVIAPVARAQGASDSARARVPKDAGPPASARTGAAPAALRDYAGWYRGFQENAAGSCTPRALPTPSAGANAEGYFPSGALPFDSASFWVRVTHTDSTFTLVVAADTLGTDAAPPIAGVLRPDGSSTHERTLELGPEAGARPGTPRLFGVHVLGGRGGFSGAGADVRWQATGSNTFRFHEENIAGPLFTTCTHPFTVRATRASR